MSTHAGRQHRQHRHHQRLVQIVARGATGARDPTSLKSKQNLLHLASPSSIVARTVDGAGLPTAVYGAAATFGTAGTGTAISTLSGAAATSATTALLGFGSAALGGVVLFGLGVAGAIVAGRYCGKVGGKIVKAVRAAQTDSARDET